ncbi:flavodoxin domain-containing protein [Blastococcus capsensis]|uniref:flavodoxin domain-containing protein n=1 Tax=Blastococcus capsensis TaxID=1564163 RepID=UPI00253FF4AA|nr:flavodoxin domain-containing protein [Blastococcus capsensis]MDK3255641.1 flavodoxin domain-containing protein [Blastococcus capsensis]
MTVHEGPRVLVAFASRHGATREIAAAVVRGLLRSDAGRRAGLSAVLAPVQQRPDPAGFDAVVLGSAVYAGRWLEPAWRYVGAVAPELRSRPTWLFSSGLDVGPAGTRHDVDDVRWIREAIGARDHRVFGGRLDRRLLSAAERQVWSRPAGDFRDWESVRSSSEGIAAHLAGPPPVPVGGARADVVLTGR